MDIEYTVHLLYLITASIISSMLNIVTIYFFAFFGDCTSLHAWDYTVEITLAGDCTDEIIQS